MADKPTNRKASTGGLQKFKCPKCGLEKPVRNAKAQEVRLCDRCRTQMVPAEGGPEAAHRSETTRLVCTNCGKESSKEEYKPGEILFCDACQGSFSPMENAPQKVQDRTFGKFRILREIGRGGMGVVYLARHSSLNRDMALKVLEKGGGADDKLIGWLVREAQSASKLRHPNIVTVHDVDSFKGEHYIAMDFIDGQAMDKLVSPKKPLKPQKAAGLLRDVADAITYAHEKGIIHRDIKPANILIDAEGKPYVMDFGIARDVRAGGGGDKAVVGTPGYMSPEQAKGSAEIDRRSDVFSLGALLFFALTGSAPYQGGDAAEIIRNTIDGDPPGLEELGKGVHQDLAAICLKAMAKDREDRYKSAKLMVDDLERFLKGEPVFAVDQGVLRILTRTLLRYKVTIALVAPLLAITAIILIVALSAKPDETKIEEERKKSEKNRKEQEDRAKREREQMEKDHIEKEFQSLKARIIEKIDSTKIMVRTKFDALDKTYSQAPEASLKVLDEIESEFRGLTSILDTLGRETPSMLGRLRADGDIADALYVKQDFPRIESLRGKIYSVMGWMEWQNNLDADKAVSFYNLALQMSPREILFNRGRGMVQFEAERWKLADHDLSITLGGDPNARKEVYFLAYAIEAKARAGMFEAIPGLMEELPAESIDRMFLEGLTLYCKGAHVAAIDKFRAVILKNPTHPRAHVMEALCSYASGGFDMAAEKCSQIIGYSKMLKIQRDPARTPRDNLIMLRPMVETYICRGQSRLKTAEAGGDALKISEAKKALEEDLRKALELVPGHKEAVELLASLTGGK